MLEKLNIVRDCWWSMASGDTYMVDENATLSSQSHALYTSLNSDDNQFIRASNSGEINYYGRYETTNINTTALYATLRAECQPPGSAVLSINNYRMAVVNVSGGINNYETTIPLTKQQIQRIHYGRIDKNYDYFDINIGSQSSDEGNFRVPDLWMDAGSGVYRSVQSHSSDSVGRRFIGLDVASPGDEVIGWQSRGTKHEDYVAYTGLFHARSGEAPYLVDNVLNGQPGIRFWGEPSGAWMECYTGVSQWLSNKPLATTSGTLYAIVIPHGGTWRHGVIYRQGEYSGPSNSGSFATFGIGTTNLAVQASPSGYPYFDIRADSTVPNRWHISYTAVVSGDPVFYGATQHASKYDRSFKLWQVNASGAWRNYYSTTNPQWIGTATYADVHTIGAISWSSASQSAYFDGFILEIMGWETPLSSGELVALNRYVYDKYGATYGDSYTPTQVKLYDLGIYYSGDATWANHKTGLPNVASETYYPTSITYPSGTHWTGSINSINDGIYPSGVDDLYLEYHGTDSYVKQNFSQLGSRSLARLRRFSGLFGAPMPSGHLGIEFTDWDSNVDVSQIYDEYGTAHGSGVGIDQYSFKNVTPSGLGGYALEASGAVGHAAMGNVLNIGSGDYSIVTWARTDDTAAVVGPIVGATHSGGTTERWYVGYDATYNNRVYSEWPTVVAINGATALNDGEWHHQGFTAKRDGNLTLYTDGSEDGTPASIAAYEGNDVQMTAPCQFMIGWGQAYGNRDVDVAYAAVYRAALTATEMATLASGLPITQKPVAEWTFNRQLTGGLDPFTKITRARMNLRMSLPVASGANNQDTLEINGYNARYKNRDHREELAYINASQRPRHSSLGYFLYGAGPIIQQSGFRNYNIELNFINPDNPSGDYQSTYHANADMLANMSFQLIGVPSGTRISAAELQVEYLPDDFTPLYTMGSDRLVRCASSGHVDAGTSNSWSAGHGGWHHQGWRLRGPTVIEEDVFTNFYTFSEGRGNTRTYPETTKAYYFPTGDEDSTVYADYLYYCPYGTEGDEGDVTPYLKDPQRREYYRDPISAADLTPDFETSPRDISSFKPHYYRHMIYHGASLDYVDVEPGDGDATSLAAADLCQIFFEDRIGLLEDFTLYFSIYRDYGFQSYGRFFHRGLMESEGIAKYEIYGDLEPNLVRFTVQGANGGDNRAEVEINQYTKEPILIWFACGYDTTLGMTVMNLYVHQDTKNYFANDWLHSRVAFAGHRKQYQPNTLVINEPPRDPYTISWGGPRTVLGSLEQLTVYEQMSRRLYLHHASPVEFGYKAGEAIEIDYQTSTSDVQVGYDASQEKDKHFLATRVSNGQYLQHNPSGVRWVVPEGSGVAEWRTRYNVFESWPSGDTLHSVYNPISTAGTNHVVAPSAVWVQLDIAHNTDHPSGLTIDVDVEFDSGTSDNWKVAHTTLEGIPSGGAIWLQYAPIQYTTYTTKHINMDDEPIKWSDVRNINITVTTKYPGYGDENYYGSLEIRSLQVYLDAYCVAHTGVNTLDLFVQGDATTETGSLDLYTLGSISVPTNDDDGSLDLYIYGIPYYASGDMTLYTHGKWPPVVLPNDDSALNLYIDGLDPPVASGDLPLFMWATANPGIRTDATLYTHSTLDPKWRLPLFLEAGTASGQVSMPLFLGNYPDSISSGNPLYIAGPSFGSGTMSLYINTPSGTEGAYVGRGSMNLYIDRDSEAHAARLSLFLANNKTLGILNTFGYGHGFLSTSPVIYASGSPVTLKNVKTYTSVHGPINGTDPSTDIWPNHDIPSASIGRWGALLKNQAILDKQMEDMHYSGRTIMGWFKMTTHNDPDPFTRTRLTGAAGAHREGGLNMRANSGVALECALRLSAEYVYASGSYGVLADLDYHHIAMVVNREIGEFQLFMDGSKVDSTYHADILNDDFDAGASSLIANTYYLGDNTVDVQLHDYRIYERAVTPSEIRSIYNGEGTKEDMAIWLLPNKPESPTIYIHGSGAPPSTQIDLFTSGF